MATGTAGDSGGSGGPSLRPHPLAKLAPGYGFDVPMLAGDHVTDDAGTGFVHTAPGHGQDDYQVWLKSGRRDIPDTVDANGAYYDSVPLFAGAAGAGGGGQEGRQVRARQRRW